MAFLHNGNLKPTTLFSVYPCNRDSVYLEGLKEGESLLSNNPYYFQDANGYVAIDDRFSTFFILSHGKTVQTLHLSWNSICATESEIVPTTLIDTQLMNSGFGLFSVLSVCVLTFILARRYFHEAH